MPHFNVAAKIASPGPEIRVRAAATCPLCGASGEGRYRGLSDRLYEAPGKWSFEVCTDRTCGLLWLNPMPIAEDLPIAYRSYFTHVEPERASLSGADAGRVRSVLRRARAAIVGLLGVERERMRLAAMGLEKEPPGRLLELGSGDGARLALMRSLGWTVEGQDVDPDAGAFRLRTQGIAVHLGPLESIGLSADTFDAIVMNHVIEHVPDPFALMRLCLHLLKPGGSLVAITPNSRSLGARMFGHAWMALEPPRHLHLFNRANLRRLANTAGFTRTTLRTSSANADGVAVGSLSIRRTGRFALERGASSIAQSLGGVAFQATESLLLPFVPDAGEECVLRAWK